jgi:hypothetical protein
VATRQGKLKLGKSSWFVKRRLSWLPQEDLVREADFCPLPEVLGGGLWLGLVVSHHDGSVVAQDILEHAPDVNDLATLLAEAMQRPLMEQTRCRPKAFHLRDNPEWDELRPHLAQLSIEVVVTEKLLKWEEVFADLIDYLKSGEWKQPVGVTGRPRRHYAANGSPTSSSVSIGSTNSRYGYNRWVSFSMRYVMKSSQSPLR